MIDAKPVLPTIPASVPMPLQTAPHVPVSLASMDSAVVMVHSQMPHSQMPHLAYPHYAASMYAAHAAPLVPGPPSMQLPTSTQHQQQPPPQQIHQQPEQPSNDLPGEPVIHESPTALTTQVESQDNRATTSSTWAEEPQEEIPVFQQDQSRNESNTWTNSSYRSNDQGNWLYLLDFHEIANCPSLLSRWTSRRLSWTWERWTKRGITWWNIRLLQQLQRWIQ